MFKKIEIWILYLTLVFVLISYIIFGSLVRREIIKGEYIPVISTISKIALFVAEIPSNLKMIFDRKVTSPHLNGINRFGNSNGFSGTKEDNEKYLLLSRFDGDLNDGVVELVDLRDFNVLFKWNPDIDEFWEKIEDKNSEKWRYLKRDRNDKRFILIHPLFTDNGSLIFKFGSPLVKIDYNSKLEWILDDQIYHHSIEEDYEGNLWVCVSYHPYKISKKYVGIKYDNYIDDGVRKLSPNGEILFDKSISELFIENKMEELLFTNTDKFKRDPIHLNDIQPVEYDSKFWKRGDIFISLRNVSIILLYRPSNNKIIWKFNGKTFNQHDVDILNSNTISIFDNNMKMFYSGGNVDGNNRVGVYNFLKDEYLFYLNKSLIKEDVKTATGGRSQILPNGDLLVEETNYGRLLYFNNDGSLKWTYVNSSKTNNTFDLGWSRILYENEDLKLIAKFLQKKEVK